MNGSATRPMIVTVGVLALTGCSVSIGHRKDTETGTVEMRGIVNGYASINGLSEWDGDVIEASVLKFRRGEIVQVEVWPIVGVGVGVAGLRLRVLPLEVGIGALFYHPRPPGAGKRQAVDHDDHDDHDADDADDADHNDDDDDGNGDGDDNDPAVD